MIRKHEECLQNLNRKTSMKETSRKYKRRSKGNIKINVKWIVFETVDWVYLALIMIQWSAVGSTLINFYVP
jgi:hypothetical protein